LPVQVAVEASEPPEPVEDVGNHDGPTVAASVLRVLAAASGPLTRRPHLRPWVGYLAVWTLFNAACLLGYNFFMREPVAPSPRAPGANSADSARASDSPGADSASDGHGGATKPDPGKTAKATPKPRTRSALPKKDAHGGGH
jgi:hypothetical protein